MSLKFPPLPPDDDVLLITFDEDREGLSKNERDLNINFASPSKLDMEFVEEFWPKPNTLLSFVFDVLVRRPVEEICKINN